MDFFLNYIYPLLPSVISGILLYEWQSQKEKKEKQEVEKKVEQDEFRKTHLAIVKGVEALLRDRLLASIETCLSNGYVTIATLEVLTSMFEAYQSLGGNGIVHQMFNRLIKLPHVPPGDAQ